MSEFHLEEPPTSAALAQYSLVQKAQGTVPVLELTGLYFWLT